MPNQFDYPDAWMNQVPENEPEAVSRLWDRASRLFLSAMHYREGRRDPTTAKVRVAQAYGCLKQLRELGSGAGHYVGKKFPGVNQSKLMNGRELRDTRSL